MRAALALAGCFIGACVEDVSLAHKACDADHACVAGFVCVDRVCVVPGADGEGEGVASEGEGVSSEGEGVSSEGEGVSSEGEGVSGEGEGEGVHAVPQTCADVHALDPAAP